MDIIKKLFSKEKRNSTVMESFGIRLYNQFVANEAYRRSKELAWLEDLRAYKGLYDPAVKIDINQSHVYPKLTRSKVNIVLSRLHEMLFPETDRNWEIEATPEPKLSPELVKQIVYSLIKPPPVDPQTGQPQIDPQTGQPVPPQMPTVEEVQEGIRDFARGACGKMEAEMDDQLDQMDYSEETKKVLRSGLTYGTGILKGPLVFQRSKSRWQPNTMNEYEEIKEDEDVPYMEFVRIWDWYPDMTVTDLESIDGSFQRHVMTKHDLRKLMQREDFYADVIKEYITDHPSGDYVPRSWEVDLQSIEVEAGSGSEGKKTMTSSSGDSRSSYRQMGIRYEPLEFWGFIDGRDLEACGVEDVDPELEYAANVWILGKKVIKAMLFNGALDHYKVFYYEKDETSIFGEGLARIMRHSQLAISAASRMTLNNAAIVAGPQVEVNWSLLTPGTDFSSFYSGKIWFREGRGLEAQYPAIRSLEFNSHIPDLMSISKFFLEFADQETCLPTWMIGQQVNNETAQATSGRMSTIAVSIKDVVKNFDSFTEKVIRDLYAWNMEFNPRQDIKGDYKCKARGVSSLVMKEIRMAALANLKNSFQPEDWMYIPRREFLEETIKSHDLDIDIRSEEEAQKYAASQRDERAIELAYAQQEAEVAYKKSQTMAQLTKAKKFNVEATKDSQTPPELPQGTDPRMQDAELQGKNVENLSKTEQIRRDEERHQLELQHANEQHQAQIAQNTAKTSVETGTKLATTQHGMSLKEREHEFKQKMAEKQASQQPNAGQTGNEG